MLEEVADDVWLFLAVVEVSAGCVEEPVGCCRAGFEDSVLGVVVEVLGGVQVGAVAGQVDDFQECLVLGDEGARASAAVGRVAIDDEDQLAALGGLEQAAQEVDEDVLGEAPGEESLRGFLCIRGLGVVGDPVSEVDAEDAHGGAPVVAATPVLLGALD